jgi:hypothetical protein
MQAAREFLITDKHLVGAETPSGLDVEQSCCSQEDVVMQIETPTRSDFSLKREIAGPRKDVPQTDEDAELEWLLSHRLQEPVHWPRVFPGL